MTVQAGSVALGWLLSKASVQKLIAFALFVIVVVKLAWWCITNPKYTLPPVFGILAAIYWWNLTVGLWVLAAGYAISVWLWGRHMLWASEIDTWNELRRGVPRLFKVRKHWPRIMKKMRLENDGAMPVLTSMHLSTSGIVAEVDTSDYAKHVSVMKKHEADIATAFRADRVLFKGDRNWLATVRIDWGAHLRREYKLHDMPQLGGYDRWPCPIPFAIAEAGGAATLVGNEPILVGGTTGGGKSNAAWAIIAGYIERGVPLMLDVIDPKGEFAECADNVGNGFINSYITGLDTEPAEYDAVMQAFYDDLKERSAAMGKSTLHTPTEEEPLRILVVDEGLPIAASLKSQGLKHPLVMITSQGRAVGFIPLFLTQVAQKDVLGLFRDLTSNRLSLRTGSRFLTEVVLGEGCEGDGARCSILDAEHDKGVGYMPARGGYMGWRSPHILDADRKVLARGEYPEAPAAILDDASKPRIVYALWDHADELLYIGQTRLDRGTPLHEVEKYSDTQLAERAAANRLAEHLKEQPWAGQIAKVTVRGVYPNKQAGLDAEELLIRTEKPPKNKVHATYNKGLINA